MANPRSRSPLRALAPLALVAFVIAVVLVVAGSKSGGSQNAPTKATDTSTSKSRTTPKKKTTTTKRKPAATTYTVKTGDNLGSIAEKTRVPVDKLRELNPDLDPQALVTGQKIKLKG